ncbi:MAG: hypothetical protein F6K58_22475 [Symploca sp. SIO2E9]|nr:hypothetical protein [Symploca sp. SIO2E9]
MESEPLTKEQRIEVVGDLLQNFDTPYSMLEEFEGLEIEVNNIKILFEVYQIKYEETLSDGKES